MKTRIDPCYWAMMFTVKLRNSIWLIPTKILCQHSRVATSHWIMECKPIPAFSNRACFNRLLNEIKQIFLRTISVADVRRVQLKAVSRAVIIGQGRPYLGCLINLRTQSDNCTLDEVLRFQWAFRRSLMLLSHIASPPFLPFSVWVYPLFLCPLCPSYSLSPTVSLTYSLVLLSIYSAPQFFFSFLCLSSMPLSSLPPPRLPLPSQSYHIPTHLHGASPLTVHCTKFIHDTTTFMTQALSALNSRLH
jgi:hypothetical protein